jgi:hypothetical protein
MTRKDLTLVSRINQELFELDLIVKRILKAWEKGVTENDDLYLDSVALNLHGFYFGLEKVFELIARNIDQSIPSGEAWHQELLRQMFTEIKEIRPAIISRESFLALDEYRGFRHVVRNVYTFNLSFRKLEPLVSEIQKVLDQVKKEISNFLSLLENTD